MAAEDTRRTAEAPVSLRHPYPHDEFLRTGRAQKTPRLLARLAAGESVALVSDAGTPGISDPGYRLVRAAMDAGFRVEAIPGASSVLTALVSSGLPTSSFSFVGFPPPRQQARDRWLAELGARRETLVFFEAPHRVRGTLEAILRVVGDRPVVVGRELTKVHEELIRGKISDVIGRMTEIRGEFTIVLGGAQDDNAPTEPLPSSSILLDVFCQITEHEGLSRREAIGRLADRYGMSSRDIYKAIEDARRSVERQNSAWPARTRAMPA